MLKTLEVYKELKDLRAYYVNTIHGGLRADIKHSVGLLVLNQLFAEVEHLARISCLRGNKAKEEEADRFLAEWEVLLDRFEFLEDMKVHRPRRGRARWEYMKERFESVRNKNINL